MHGIKVTLPSLARRRRNVSPTDVTQDELLVENHLPFPVRSKYSGEGFP